MQVNLTKGVITVGSWTLLSRVLGMVREILLSTFIGAGPLLDAFVAAFRFAPWGSCSFDVISGAVTGTGAAAVLATEAVVGAGAEG